MNSAELTADRLTETERGLVSAIHGLIESGKALRAAQSEHEELLNSLAPEGAGAWMWDESVRPQIAASVGALTAPTLADMGAITEACRAIVAANEAAKDRA